MRHKACLRRVGNLVGPLFLVMLIGGMSPVWAPPAWALATSPDQPASRLALKPVVTSGLVQPLFLTHASDGTGRLFVVEQQGFVRILHHGRLITEPFLNVASRISTGGERGLLGLAFHPDFARNGRYFVNYTRAVDGATVIAEFHVSSDPSRSSGDETILLTIPQPYGNHNGGMIAFGPDGFLYIGMGDGGAGGDPENRAQNPRELLGKILRIDVDRGTPYGVPGNNMFRGKDGRPEIFAVGFRNPWRFSFDRMNGRLWVGDVGQNRWEEIDRVRVGENHGWRIMEGRHCFNPREGCAQKGLTLPVAEYGHGGSRCAITGGYVYRGHRLPGLGGTYVFGDYCSGEVMGLMEGKVRVLLSTSARISSFGEDESGEVYVIDHQGAIFQLVPRVPTP